MSRGRGLACWVVFVLAASGCGRSDIDFVLPDAAAPLDASIARDARPDTRADTAPDVTIDAHADAGTDALADATTPPDSPSCPAGFTLCGDACVDVQDDAENCGGCLMTCPNEAICVSATCVPTCAPPLIACGEACVDPSTSDTNCGATGDCLGANAGSACPTGAPCHDGACTCPSAYPDACADACTVFAVDPKNCGGCGHDCLGGACTGGVCGPYLVSNAVWTVATLVANDAVVAWETATDLDMSDTFVEYAPVGGGPRTGLYAADGVTPVGPLAIDATALYAGGLGPTLVRLPIDAGAQTTLLMKSSSDIRIFGLAIDGTRVVFTQGGSMTDPAAVATLPVGGGAVSTLLSEGMLPPSMTARAGIVYLADYPAGALSSLPVTGGTPTVIISGRTGPTNVVVDDRNLYWLEPGVGSEGMVLQAPLAGGTIVTLASGLSSPTQVAVTTTSVAWVDEQGVQYVPIGGGATTNVAADDDEALAANGSTIFWSTGFYQSTEVWGLVLP